MTLMKAAICTGYGPPEVLVVRDVAKPQPRADEVLVHRYVEQEHKKGNVVLTIVPEEPARALEQPGAR